MQPIIKLVTLVFLFLLLGFSTAFGQGGWDFDCLGDNFFSWQSRLSDSAGNPVAAGDYSLEYCFYEDSAATMLIGCCSTIITIPIAKFLVSGAAASTRFFSTKFAYPVPINEDVVKRRGLVALVFPEIWLQLTFEGEVLEPTFKIFSVPFAGVALRVSGDIVTQPGKITVLSPAPADSARIVLSADSTGASIELYNSAGELKISMTSADSTVTFGVPVVINGDLTVSGKATIGPGHTNTGTSAFAAGQSNISSGTGATVSGGYFGTASGDWSVIGGGNGNQSTVIYCTVAGGAVNTATATAATIGGGLENSASANYSTVGGGQNNTSSDRAATVGGGSGNTANARWATVAGGELNTADTIHATVGGGRVNTASGAYATVSGGLGNTASGLRATVPGGQANAAAGDFSFAAGKRAKANHNGSFVWADQTNSDFASTAGNQFNIRASGGTRIYSSSDLGTGVTLSAGGGAWIAVSDSAVKRNIRLVDQFDILEKVASLPISRWSYKTQSPDIEHIGPMAQDFYATFGVGEDEKGISTLDPDGVALAAIQALYQENQELKERLRRLEEQFKRLTD